MKLQSLFYFTLFELIAQRELGAEHTNYSLGLTAVASDELKTDFKYIPAMLSIVSQPE